MKANIAAIITVIVCMLAALLCGCGTGEVRASEAPQSAEPSEENPFDYEGPPEVLGSVSHSGNWPEREEGRPLEYTGGELEVPYRACGEGTGRNVGFLLFLDGIPQPYRLNGEGEYAYMHPFTLAEDGEEEQFTFCFFPVTGKSGDTLTFTVADIFNAGFKPDMVSASNFGFYGNALGTVNLIRFSADPEDGGAGAKTVEALENLRVTNELMTADFVEKNLGPEVGMTSEDGRTREDRLDETVFIFDTYDGEPELNDLDVTGKDTLHVAVDLCGIPGLTYTVTFYADNVPLSDGERSFRDVTLEKGKAARVEADLDLGALDGVTTFYAIACAKDGEDDGTRGLGLLKTGSLPIWSRDKLGAESGGDASGGGASDGEAAGIPEALDKDVRSVRYGRGDTVLVRKSDGLYLVDMKTGEVTAEGPAPELESAAYYPTDGGFCAVGEAERESGDVGLTGAGLDGGTVCVFLDDTLSETDRFSLSDIAGGDRYIMCTAISPDGKYAAFSVMNDGIYLYTRGTGEVTLLRDLSRNGGGDNGGLTMAAGLWCDENSSELIFADSSHFGRVGLDGEGFVCAAVEGFDPQGPVGYAGGRVFFNESFFTASGAMAVADVESLEVTVYRHSEREGSGDLYVSRDGGYFATAAFDGSLTVRVYGTEDDSLRLEHTITDENGDIFAAAPGILILDDLKLCIVKLGGYADVPARVEVLSFE